MGSSPFCVCSCINYLLCILRLQENLNYPSLCAAPMEQFRYYCLYATKPYAPMGQTKNEFKLSIIVRCSDGAVQILLSLYYKAICPDGAN